ncbi:MAG: hypothetical protein N3D10_03185 [Candidatus Micrarchaeota archaeon]|nr:hypothetical protein [Candidatus Micrarchaeota archaeon]
MLQTEHKEIEKEKTKNKFELFFPKDFYEGLKALLERKKTLKFSVLVDGKNIGEMSFSLPTKTKDVNEIKGMIESGLQELLAQKNIEGAVHLIRLVFIPEEGEKQEVPQEAPIALDIYAESLNRKKEFDEQKDKIEGRGVLVPIVKEEKEGYVVIFPYPQQFPLEQISREYIERASEPEIKKIGEILNSIKESERKNVTVYITIEDYTKLKENETIKEKILTNYQSKFKSLEVKFKVLTTQDIAQLIEEGAIKENQIDNLKNALINAKNKDNQSVWTDKQKQQILESNQEELKEFLKNNYAELYFEKNVRDKYPILEQIYNNYRKINVEQGPLNIEFDKNNLEILNPNRVELVLYVKVLYGNEEEKKYSNNTQKFKPLAY